MSDEYAAVRRVLDAFERSDWTEIDVRFGSVHVRLSTDPGASARDVARVDDADTAVRASPPTPTGDVPDASPDGSTGVGLDESASTGPSTLPDGAVTIASPSPGIFWRAPEPGAPPFADIGDAVGAAQTLCIVEVMKLMNHVKAGEAGEVLAVYVDNGVAVRAGEALFAVMPQLSGRSS
ncbi:MAG: biotin/lipoyl-containing protein [Ilumatobacteraceae bacterium]